MKESEVNYVRGQVSEILLSSKDLQTLISGFPIEIDGITIKHLMEE